MLNWAFSGDFRSVARGAFVVAGLLVSVLAEVSAQSTIHSAVPNRRGEAEIGSTRPADRTASAAELRWKLAQRQTRGTDQQVRATDVVRGQLSNISWQDLIGSLEGLTPGRLALAQVSGSQVLQTEIASPRGTVQLTVDPASGRYSIRGPRVLTVPWSQAIDLLDRQKRTEASGQSRIVPLRNASTQSVTRTVALLQAARRQASSAVRWGGDLVGLGPSAAAAHSTGNAAATTPIQLAQAEPAPQPTPTNPPAEGQQPPANPAPAEQGANGQTNQGSEVGVEGGLMGPVQVEFVEGLDAIIIRGRKPDVDRIMAIIEDLERLSAETEPAIELVPLKHVKSESMAELVGQLNEQALQARRGSVTITALGKPNALLVIGRVEGVRATIELIERLDQPVAPTTQFQVFQLRYAPAPNAKTTIDTFFADRGGLGPRIQTEADFRTNSLIVYASPRDMAEVRQLIEQIDVAQSKAVNEVRVFKLKNALAEDLAPVLESTLRGEAAPAAGGQPPGAQPGQGGAAGGTAGVSRSSMLTMTRIDAQGQKILKSSILTDVRVAADTRANSLVVTAPIESMELIAALVSQLDELPTAEAQIKVFTIVNGDAAALTEMLQELFGEQTGSQAQQSVLQSAAGAGESSLVPLRFSTDLRTNSIIATGSASDLAVVEAILLRLDASDASQRRSRVYRLQNAPALDVANAINEFLRTERQIQQVAPDRISPFEQIEREVVVVPEVVSNSLIISATPRYFDEVAKLVEELDERPPMVLIQVLIAEVKLGNLEELGFELGLQDSLLFDRSVITDVVTPGFNFNNQPLGNSSSPQSLASREDLGGQALTNFALGRSNGDLGYGGLVLSASSESINILIRALQESRRLDVLSRPQVMTLNNQPAFVLVGARVPRIQSTQLTQFGTVNSTILDNVGLLLGVTPRISPDGLVVMEIDAEKSELGPTSEGIPISVNLNGDVIRSPIINTTVAQTTVSARSGQTVILGGLITKSQSVTARRVPYLSEIPLLGDLFRFDSVDEERTELLIIMTPYIVRKTEDADLLNQIETERMSWCLADVINVHGTAGTAETQIIRTGSPEVIYPDVHPAAGGAPGGVPNEPPTAPVNPPALEDPHSAVEPPVWRQSPGDEPPSHRRAERPRLPLLPSLTLPKLGRPKTKTDRAATKRSREDIDVSPVKFEGAELRSDGGGQARKWNLLPSWRR